MKTYPKGNTVSKLLIETRGMRPEHYKKVRAEGFDIRFKSPEEIKEDIKRKFPHDPSVPSHTPRLNYELIGL